MKSNSPLVPIHSSNNLLVEPIWQNPIDDIEGPLYQQYIRKYPSYKHVYVRSEVATMLTDASHILPSRYKLIIRAGHRPLEVQYKLLELVRDKYLQENPASTQEEALEFARTFVSDPRIKRPPHCCGAAVDVDCLDRNTGKLVDFGCPVNTDSEISFIDTDKITKTQKANRDMLQSTMKEVGFAPYKPEWWHFSYKDATWAEFYNSNTPLYEIAELKDV